MKARVKLSLHVLCHKPAGRPWVSHLLSLDPSSLGCKMRGRPCFISKTLPPLECCDSLLLLLAALEASTSSYISWEEAEKGKECGVSPEEMITENDLILPILKFALEPHRSSGPSSETYQQTP